jgi:hypothetical protein|nr:MAG TPA: hypothetical protein [Caudoviricetes sp.]
MIKLIMELLNFKSKIQIIPAFTNKEPPSKPYATYQILNINSADFFGYTERKYLESDKKYKEQTEYRMTTRVQFDVFGENQEKTLEQAIDLRELILFKLRYEFGIVKVGIVKNSEIKILNEVINAKYEYRASFDITFEFIKMTDERIIELVREIKAEVEKRGE